MRIAQRFLRSQQIVAKSGYATSTVTSLHLAPAVSFLVHQNRIDLDTVSRIPRSGPGNRLLKGDVLKYLKDPSFLDQIAGQSEFIPIPHAFYTVDIDVSSLSNLKTSLSDLLARAVASSLKQVPEVNARWSTSGNKVDVVTPTSIFLSRMSTFGKSQIQLSLPDDKEVVNIPSFTAKEVIKSVSPGVFSLLDLTDMKVDEVPSYYIQPGQTGILFVLGHESSSSSKKVDNILDFLSGVTITDTQPESKSKVIPDRNIWGAANMSQSVSTIRLELLVDDRAVSQKIAKKFLTCVSSNLDRFASISK